MLDALDAPLNGNSLNLSTTFKRYYSTILECCASICIVRPLTCR